MSVPMSVLASKVGELLDHQVRVPRSPRLEELEAEVQHLLGETELRERELEQQNQQLRQAQRDLEAYRDRYIDLYDRAPLGYVTLDEDGYVQEANLAGASLLGVVREVLIGYAFSEYLAQDDEQAFLDHVRQCAGDRREVTSELRLVSKGGRTITAQFHSVPVEGPTDETFCKTAIADITERRRAEEALEAERNLLRTLIDNLPDCVYIKDAEGRFVAANLATARVMGVETPKELMGKTDADFYPAELAAAYRADEKAILQSGQPVVNKDEPHAVRGEPRTILTTKVPLKDRHGNVTGLVGISRDITERVQTEQALREALRRLQTPPCEATPGTGD